MKKSKPDNNETQREFGNINAGMAVLAMHIVASGTDNLSDYRQATGDSAHPVSSNCVRSEDELNHCIGLIQNGRLKIEQVVFENELVELVVGNRVSGGFETRILPFWVTEENIEKINRVSGSYVWTFEVWQDSPGKMNLYEVYKSNVLLENCGLIEDSDEIGMDYFIMVHESIDDFVHIHLLCRWFAAFFKDVKVRSVVSMHAAARLGDFSAVPPEMLSSPQEWSFLCEYEEPPFHYAALAGHFDKIPASVMDAYLLLATGVVDHDFALKHPDLLELEWVTEFDLDASPDPSQEDGIARKTVLQWAYACPIALAVAHGQADLVVKAIQGIAPGDWVKVNHRAHATLADVAKKVGIEDKISNLLEEIARLPPPPSEDERDMPFPMVWD